MARIDVTQATVLQRIVERLRSQLSLPEQRCYETLDADDVQSIIDGKKLDKPTVDDLLEAEQAKAETPAPDAAADEPLPEPPAETLPEPG